MMAIRDGQFEAMEPARRLQVRWDLARRIATERRASGDSCTSTEALQQSDVAMAAGDYYEMHEFKQLVRLSQLLGELTEADRKAVWPERILADPLVSYPGQRLLRAEDELRHRRQIQASNARLVAKIRAGQTE